MTTDRGDDAHPDVPVPTVDEQADDRGEAVGPSDVRADALRSGAEVGPDQAPRADREDVAVGRDDAAADVTGSGGDG